MHIKLCSAALAITAAAALFHTACADSIKIKNDGTLNGVIRGEDETSITIAIGVGTMKVRKSEVEYVKKAADAENAALEAGFRKKGIERGTYAPPGLEETADKLRELSGGRNTVDAARQALDSLKQEIDEKSGKFKSLRSDFGSKNSEIHGMDPKSNVTRYNQLITELNMLSVKISALAEDLNKMNVQMPETQRAYWKAITDYGNDVGDFRLYIDKQVEAAKKRGMTADESLFFDTVKKSLADLERGLNRDEIAVSKSSEGMTAKVTLNGDITCILAVDTGATLVVITKEVADRLMVNPNDSTEDVSFTLADGSVIKSKVIKIKSVRVGNSTVYDVPAAIIDKSPAPGIDGLLGMSFLSNFNIKIDVPNGKLILETVK